MRSLGTNSVGLKSSSARSWDSFLDREVGRFHRAGAITAAEGDVLGAVSATTWRSGLVAD